MDAPQNLDHFSTLVDIIAKLRAPDGCPWDRRQTHQSLRENLLEETYEVLSALDEKDYGKLCGELGDLMMQIVFHIQVASENREFTLGDVMTAINSKLIYRHPHIFGTAQVKDADEVAKNWEELKKGERAQGASILSTIPDQLPALNYAQTMQRRVAQVGFDWPDVGSVKEKMTEELNELQDAGTPARRAAEFGDVLFTLVNIGRHMEIDSETALRETNRKFKKRFVYMERLVQARGLDMKKMTLEELDKLWEEAKEAEG